MAKTLIGMVTFGNLSFTKLALESISATPGLDYFVVIGKPGDVDTQRYLESCGIPYIMHEANMGFPYSLNDIYDYAWKKNNYDYVILAGNDIVVYDGSIENLINVADTTDYACISSLQYDVKDLIKDYPDTAQYFSGTNLIFNDFTVRPWENFTPDTTDEIHDMQLYDIQNLCLYKKEVFDKIGYTDVGFFPAYYVDNDYARRISLSDIKCCTVQNSRFFHFWSRTIHQGSGGSNDRYFRNNRSYYRLKWQGDFGFEKTVPNLKIDSRLLEEQIINHWRNA